MPLIQSDLQFGLDILTALKDRSEEIKRDRFKDHYLAIGLEISKLYPFKKNENKSDEMNEYYENYIHVTSQDNFYNFIQEAKSLLAPYQNTQEKFEALVRKYL